MATIAIATMPSPIRTLQLVLAEDGVLCHRLPPY
jgi:hypothetical protein